jgi:serine/threonine protein kinase
MSPETTAPLSDAPRIPGYEIQSVLGKGGMGLVYKAKQVKLGRVVAVKALNFSVFDSGDMSEADRAIIRQRFLREAAALARMSHENIVQVHDLVEDADGREYIVMEYVEGRDLSELLAKGARVPIPDAIGIVADVARALQHAHERGIIHRDIKPQNIMITRRSKVKVADFGIASMRSSGVITGDLTSGQGAIGTPRYMSPEQFIDSSGADHRSDIYSLSVVLYRLICGQFPFDDSNPFSLAQRIRCEPPPPPSSWRSDIHPNLERLLLKGLAKDPADRYQSAAEYEQALRDSMSSAALLDPMLEPAREVIQDRADASGGFAPTLMIKKPGEGGDTGPGSSGDKAVSEDAVTSPSFPSAKPGRPGDSRPTDSRPILSPDSSGTASRRKVDIAALLKTGESNDQLPAIDTGDSRLDISLSLDSAMQAVDKLFDTPTGRSGTGRGRSGTNPGASLGTGATPSRGFDEKSKASAQAGGPTPAAPSLAAPHQESPSKFVRRDEFAQPPPPPPAASGSTYIDEGSKRWVSVYEMEQRRRRRRILVVWSSTLFAIVAVAVAAGFLVFRETQFDAAMRHFLEEELAQARAALAQVDPGHPKFRELEVAITSIEDSNLFLSKDQVLEAAKSLERIKGELETSKTVTSARTKVRRASEEKARRLWVEAVALHDAGKYRDAEELLLKAQELHPHIPDLGSMVELARLGILALGAMARADDFAKLGDMEQAFAELEAARQEVDLARNKPRFLEKPELIDRIYNYNKDQGFLDRHNYLSMALAYENANAKSAMLSFDAISRAFIRERDLDTFADKIRRVGRLAENAQRQQSADLAESLLDIEPNPNNGYHRQMVALLDKIGKRRRTENIDSFIARGRDLAAQNDQEGALKAFFQARQTDLNNEEVKKAHQETAERLFDRAEKLPESEIEEKVRLLNIAREHSFKEDFVYRQAQRKLRLLRSGAASDEQAEEEEAPAP